MLEQNQKQRRLLKKRQEFINDPDVDVWALDEVRFQQHGTTCKLWVPPEIKDPVVYHYPTRKSVGYFGAVRLRDGKFEYKRECGKFNAQSIFEFLKYLRKTTAASSKKIVIIIDNAPYHHARLHKEWRDACSDRFILLFMPPYSPELNPIERVWKLTRRLCTHNKYLESLEEIMNRVESQFNQWVLGSDVLCKLCAVN